MNVMLPATLSSMMSLTVGQRWSESQCPYAAAVCDGFLLLQNKAWPHVARVCSQFLDDEDTDATNAPLRSPPLNPSEILLNVMHWWI